MFYRASYESYNVSVDIMITVTHPKIVADFECACWISGFPLQSKAETNIHKLFPDFIDESGHSSPRALYNGYCPRIIMHLLVEHSGDIRSHLD